MAEPFLSEIRILAFSFAPRGWAHCNGQLLPISQNHALFALLGTTFGGDGRVTFALPDLRGRTPIHVGPGHELGEMGGAESHTLGAAELPAHTHTPAATAQSGTAADRPSSAPDGQVTLGRPPVVPAKGAKAHPNVQPYLTLSFCIALQGIFPSRD